MPTRKSSRTATCTARAAITTEARTANRLRPGPRERALLFAGSVALTAGRARTPVTPHGDSNPSANRALRWRVRLGRLVRSQVHVNEIAASMMSKIVLTSRSRPTRALISSNDRFGLSTRDWRYCECGSAHVVAHSRKIARSVGQPNSLRVFNGPWWSSKNNAFQTKITVISAAHLNGKPSRGGMAATDALGRKPISRMREINFRDCRLTRCWTNVRFRTRSEKPPVWKSVQNDQRNLANS